MDGKQEGSGKCTNMWDRLYVFGAEKCTYIPIHGMVCGLNTSGLYLQHQVVEALCFEAKVFKIILLSKTSEPSRLWDLTTMTLSRTAPSSQTALQVRTIVLSRFSAPSLSSTDRLKTVIRCSSHFHYIANFFYLIDCT